MDDIPKDLEELLDLLEEQTAKEWPFGRRVRLPNDQVIYLNLNTQRDEHCDYRPAEVSIEQPKAQTAAVGTLVALKGHKLRPERLRYAFPAAKLTREELGRDDPSLERLGKALRHSRFSRAKAHDFPLGQRVEYLRKLLHYYRPKFDSLVEYEQIALMEKAAEYVNEYLEALRRLTAFLEHGDPYSGLPHNTVKTAARDVRAAELKDIDGLSYPEIGKLLGLARSEQDVVKGDHQYARKKVVPNGRDIFIRALGEQGYEHYVQSKKAEAEWWRSLPEDKKLAEQLADVSGIPSEKVHSIMVNEGFSEEVAELDSDQRWWAVFIRTWVETFGEESNEQKTEVDSE
jgi:hypothetical protein